MTAPAGSGQVVLLYDGYCALCNGAVRFLLRFDRRAQVHYAPLEGAFARTVLSRHPGLQSIDSVILLDRSDPSRESIHVRSDAVIRVIVMLGGGWRFFRVFRLIPRPLRDALYDLIAASRYKVLRRYDACPLPPPHVRDLFLE